MGVALALSGLPVDTLLCAWEFFLGWPFSVFFVVLPLAEEWLR
jgi:hypothetical protein